MNFLYNILYIFVFYKRYDTENDLFKSVFAFLFITHSAAFSEKTLHGQFTRFYIVFHSTYMYIWNALHTGNSWSDFDYRITIRWS